MSRLQEFRFQDEDHFYLNMPELYGKAYLIDWLSDLGFAMYSTMGMSPLTYCEIYHGLDGTNLTPWEAKTIHTLSCEYVSQSQKSTDKTCQPPFSLPKTKKQIAIELGSLKEAFRSLPNKKAKR